MEPVSRTAFYCTGVRALDARSPRPVCGDSYAGRFLDDDAWRAFEPFRHLRGANITNRTRHRIIDDLVRERLAADPDQRVVLLGAGFDSRAFRMQGGRWLEIDHPQILAWKEARLPAADCPNRLTRLSIEFGAAPLDEHLAPFADPDRVTVIIEGVLFYIDEPKIRAMLRAVRSAFPRAEIVCDVMTPAFFARYSRTISRTLRELGAIMQPPPRPIRDIFADEGYRQHSARSITRRAAELGQMPWFMQTLLYVSPTFTRGFSVCTFLPA